MMASGWTLLAAAAALGVAAVLALRLLSQKPAAERIAAGSGPLLLGPLLVALGIIFGDDPLVGYSLIAAGVVASIVVTRYRERR